MLVQAQIKEIKKRRKENYYNEDEGSNPATKKRIEIPEVNPAKHKQGRRKFFETDAVTSKKMRGVLFDPNVKNQELAELKEYVKMENNRAVHLSGRSFS